MHAQKKFPLSSEWDKEAWRVRRNEKTLNFKKEISGRDWVLTRVFRLSILKSGEKVRGRLVDVPCLLVGGRRYENQMLGGTYMYVKIGIV